MATLERKTKTTYPQVGMAFNIEAHGSVMLAAGEPVKPADHFVIDGEVEPALTLKIEGIGSLYLAPAEVRALVEGRAKVIELAKDGRNYIARGVRFSR